MLSHRLAIYDFGYKEMQDCTSWSNLLENIFKYFIDFMQPPVPKHPWWGKVLKATAKGPPCLQYNPTKFLKVYGSESCLGLNVYAPVKY